MKFRICVIIVGLFVLLETIESIDGYKFRRPYKFYRPKPPRYHRPRWHPYGRPSKYYRSKGPPSKDYGTSYQRYAPYYDDSPADDEPYSIVIQLPKRSGRRGTGPYQRNYEGESRDYGREYDDYIEDDEDEATSTLTRYNPRKNVRIKLVKGPRPKLHIKIARSDEDASLLTLADVTDETTTTPSTDDTDGLTESTQDWMAETDTTTAVISEGVGNCTLTPAT